MKPLADHPAVADEAEAAADWYNDQSHDLRRKFVKQLRAVYSKLSEFPKAWPNLKKGVRKCRIVGFPYNVIYVERPAKIWIVAVAHDKRRPNYWSKRLKDIL